jgi:hypothetical protein
VHAGNAGDEALHRVVRAGDAVEHLGDGQPDGQEPAVEDVEDQDPGEGGQREEEFAAAEGSQAPESGQVDLAGRGVHDDRTEGRGGKAGQHRTGDEQDRPDAGQGPRVRTPGYGRRRLRRARRGCRCC